jgi:hypothetical protein
MISCADIHLRSDIPIGRVDDYFTAQENKFRFLLEQGVLSPPLLIVGDLVDKSKSFELLYWIMSLIDEYNTDIMLVCGQHDLPWHSLSQVQKSVVGILGKAEYITLLTDPTTPYIYGDYAIWGCSYGQVPIHPKPIDKIKVLAWHQMVVNKGEELWEGQVSPIAGKLLRQYKEYDFIITGDNHTSFSEKSYHRMLLNSGSMKRDEIDQINHKPCCFKIDNGKVETIFLPIEEDVLDDSHVANKRDRDIRIENFKAKLKIINTKTKREEIHSIDFKEELKQFLNINPVNNETEDIIWRCVDVDHKGFGKGIIRNKGRN